MTLRHRLVAAQLALVAIGLGVFAAVSYRLYSNSQYERIDNQLQAVSPDLDRYLGATGPTGQGQGAPPGGPDDRGTGGLPPGSYVQLWGSGGQLLSTRQVPCSYESNTSCPLPSIPRSLNPGTGPGGRIYTVGAFHGSATFRVLCRPADVGLVAAYPAATGGTVVTAIPMTDVTRSLHRLVFLELAVGLGVLLGLSGASLLIIRSGMRPLERLASTARAIARGDLSRRASPADERSEVGQLGLAFNTMMANIEGAFAERDNTEARLRQFLADASHELRTPLTSIRGYAELYRIGAAADGPELERVMHRIEQHSVEMSALVEELLLLARLDETRSPERVEVDLGVLASEALHDTAVTAPDRHLTLDAPEPVMVVGDPSHLRQAVANLLTNSVRHTPAGSPIELAVGADGGVASLTVRDHGPGLPADALTRVFDRFWRADPSRSGGGSGLGLAIVAAVAAEHGGQAKAANATGGGAVFMITLPIPAPVAGSATSAGQPHPASGRQPHQGTTAPDPPTLQETR
jgi:two-component system OmpR family sensor kinase